MPCLSLVPFPPSHLVFRRFCLHSASFSPEDRRDATLATLAADVERLKDELRSLTTRTDAVEVAVKNLGTQQVHYDYFASLLLVGLILITLGRHEGGSGELR